MSSDKTPNSAPAAIPEMSFEQAMQALEQIVSQLESGRVDLEKSISLYERGATLRAHCEQKLKSAEMRVEQIVQNTDGDAIGSKPMTREG